MGQRGRARVVALYNWPTIIRQWEEMWQELTAIARSLTREERDRLDYLQPNYFQHFSHYASRIVDDATPIQLTDRGREILAGRGSYLLHPSARGFLDPEKLQAIMLSMKSAGWLGTRARVGDLLRIAMKLTSLGRDGVLMHLMWLAKYDLVSLGERAPEHAPNRSPSERGTLAGQRSQGWKP
jgi:hypothetical protein